MTTMLAQDGLHPQQLHAVSSGKSRYRLRDLPLPPVSLAIPHRAEPLRTNPNVVVHLGPLAPDPLASASVAPTDSVIGEFTSFEGMGTGMSEVVGRGHNGENSAYQVQMAPPDTDGAVGEHQFVQWVNNTIAVFDKSSGKLEYGPVPANYLWKDFGGNCEANNNGDPVVVYDKLAKRWFLAQFSVTNGKQTGFSECIAVSTSSDATGTYWLYEFQYPDLDDYPKVGVWPNGYYVSFNMYDNYVDSDGKPGSIFLGARACAYDRDRMLHGGAGRQQCFQLSPQYFGLLPSDLDGSRTPGREVPNYFVALGGNPDTIDLWKFKVDWNNTKNTKFGKDPQNSPDSTIKVAHYNLACNGTGLTCIPQPVKVAGQEQLDSLGDRLMYRAVYRRFDDHASLIFNHSVDTGGDTSRTAIRWYELRDLEKDPPALFQQGTFAPDVAHRWIGSMAANSKGSIALGYNVSSDKVYPSLYITSRLAGDPKGTLRAEFSAVKGSGVQTCAPAPGSCQCAKSDGTPGCDTLTRWGDYSAMMIDPVDDCTFWYTGEYQSVDGAYNWLTKLVRFTVSDGCLKEKPSRSMQLKH